MKLSKRTRLVVASAIFVIALAGLNMVRSQRVDEQSQLAEKLTQAQMNLKRVQLEALSAQQAELEKQLSQVTSQFEAVKAIPSQPMGSIAATTTLFDIAREHNVEVTQMKASSPSNASLEGVTYSVISLTAKVEGDVANLVSFVTTLNNFFTTGVVNSVIITIPQTKNGGKASVDLQLIVYTYRGS